MRTETGQPDVFVFYASQLSILRDVQGRLDELIPAMEQSVDENPNISGFRAALAKSYVETGQFDDARRLLKAEAPPTFTSVPRDVVWGTTLSIFPRSSRRRSRPAAVSAHRSGWPEPWWRRPS